MIGDRNELPSLLIITIHSLAVSNSQNMSFLVNSSIRNGEGNSKEFSFTFSFDLREFTYHRLTSE